MRISDWSSDVCASDLTVGVRRPDNVQRVRRCADWLLACVDQLIEVFRTETDVLADQRAAHPPLPNSICHPPRRTVEVGSSLLNGEQGTHTRCRSEARAVGKECVLSCSYRWWQM